jgi:hypothetical protein
MCGGKEHARQTRSAVPDDEPRGSVSNPTTASTSEPPTGINVTQTDISGTNTQPSGSNVQSESSQAPRATPEGDRRVYQDILINCNSIVERYRKGEVTKASAYIDI